MVDVPVATAVLVEQEAVSRISALMLAPFTLLIALLSLAGGRIATRLGFRVTASTGLITVAIGYAALWLGLRGGELIGMVPGLALAGAGFGLVFAPISTTAIDAAPDADRGIAAAMTLVFRLLGMTLGISTLTAIAVRRLQGLVGDVSEIVQLPGESTADFLTRQTTLLYDTIMPLTLQVIRETFLLAGAIALLGLIPVSHVRYAPKDPPAVSQTPKTSAYNARRCLRPFVWRPSCRDRLCLALIPARNRPKCSLWTRSRVRLSPRVAPLTADTTFRIHRSGGRPWCRPRGRRSHRTCASRPLVLPDSSTAW